MSSEECPPPRVRSTRLLERKGGCGKMPSQATDSPGALQRPTQQSLKTGHLRHPHPVNPGVLQLPSPHSPDPP